MLGCEWRAIFLLTMLLAGCGGGQVRPSAPAEVELYFRQLPPESAARFAAGLTDPSAPLLEWYGPDGKLYLQRNDRDAWDAWESDLMRTVRRARAPASLQGRDFAALLARGEDEPWLDTEKSAAVVYLYIPAACADCGMRFGRTSRFLKEQYPGRIVLVLLRDAGS